MEFDMMFVMSKNERIGFFICKLHGQELMTL